MSRSLKVAISPCPNDTFAWGPLILGEVPSRLPLHFIYADIEELNHLAQQEAADVIKLSFFQYALLPRRKYRLLPIGAALGYGAGPLLVSRKPLSYEALQKAVIGIPGWHTTAYSLLRFFAPHAENLKAVLYSELMPSVNRGELDAAVIIHESRFTYAEYGLTALIDLGAYWSEKTGYPVPLGGIAARREMPVRALVRGFRRSLRKAWREPSPALQALISSHAQEITPAVQKSHIQLYVGPDTYRLSSTARAAIRYYVHWVRSHPMLWKR
ncbi:MAG: 1,4-dihydroxy-6-naphthoate synthase [Bacteroidia bacterium]|nr:1,4-dihydroxy-6-naphthoate synthase [Bacteroidia bacterium]MDW8235791.1 1,4-dihydroxy-6-naphthoate synthase [Bacteroidia bacterium]